MSATTPLVTIGLPVYNGSAHMRGAIDAVLSQTYENIQLLISDNCSSDDTAEIARSYCAADARVKYIKTERNIGAAGNYTFVARHAEGDYFKWISHDDAISPRFVERCVEVAERDPEIITVAPVVRVVDQSGAVQQEIRSYTGRVGWSLDPLERYRQMMEELAYCETHDDGLFMVSYEYGLHRLDLLRRTRLELPFISSDYVLVAELALWGRLAEIDDALSQFMISTRDESTSANFASWDPMAIQRMLDPSRATPWRVRLSTRQRHLEHVRAVLRSPLTPTDKVRALGPATLPTRLRLKGRLAAAARRRHRPQATTDR